MTHRIGWIGCGTHASQMLLPQLVQLDVELAAVCDTDPGRLALIARRYGIRDTYTDATELIARKGLDAVGMAIGPQAHSTLGLAAVERGLPVFLEKPPAANSADAERLAETAARKNVPVVVGFMKRYATGNRIAANILSSDDFGPVLGLMGWYMTAPTYFTGARDYDGFFLHHCVHYMDLVPFLGGGAIEEISVRTAENGPGRLLIHGSFTLSGGAIASIAMGTVQSRGNPVEFLQITGDHQRVEVDNVADVIWYRDPPFKADNADAVLAAETDALTWRPNLTAAANEDHKGYRALLSDALAAFEQAPSDAPTIADGLAALQALERLRVKLEL
ncbi:MAG: Gfo/Idh/MocA family oxidoreductase [Hyphomicrobiales bacterium]|nr:Gfo/Idh/MocA family oxidoreductase [Hyphomicrobiales bacterium]